MIREWVNSFYQAAAGASRLVGWVDALSGSLLSLAGIPIPRAIKWLYDIGAFSGALGGLDLLAPAQSAATGPMTSGLIGGGAPSLFDLGGQQGSKQYRGFGPTQNRPKLNLDFLTDTGGGGGGGGKGGGGAAKAEIDPVIQLIKQLTDEMRRLTEQTRAEEVAQQLLGVEFKNTSQAAKDQAMALAGVMDEHKKLVKIIEGMETAFENANDAIKELGNTAVDVLDTKLGQMLGVSDNLPHGTGVLSGGRNEDANILGETGPWDRGEKPENQAQEYYEKIKRQMDRLAFELTDTLDRAVYDGFQGGIKRGFASLTLSILDMIRNTFLVELQKSISTALSNATGPGGQKGGWLATIAGFAIKILGGLGAGAGSGAAGSASGKLLAGLAPKAAGGPVSAGTPYIVGERGPELFMPNSSGNIIPNGGGNTVININVPVRSAGTYSTPKSRRQLAEDIAAALAGATS